MGYDQYAVPDTVAVESSIVASLALANIRLWPIVPFFQISLKNRPFLIVLVKSLKIAGKNG